MKSARRNHVLLRLLYTAGLRLDEIARLAWRDLRERDDAGQVTAYGKGGKTRVVLLPTTVWHELGEDQRIWGAARQELFRAGLDRALEQPLRNTGTAGYDPRAGVLMLDGDLVAEDLHKGRR